VQCLICEDEIISDKVIGWFHPAGVLDHSAIPQCPHTLGPIEECSICKKGERDPSERIVEHVKIKQAKQLQCGHDADEGEVVYVQHNGRMVCEDCK